MEILLPKRNDSAQTEKLSSRTVTVVGANGAGKSRFGVEIARRIQDHAFWLSAQKALCIMPPHEVWPGSIEAMYRDAMEHSHYVSREIPTEFDQLLFLLLSEECRNLFEYKFKTPRGERGNFPETRFDRVQKLWERVFPRNKMLRAEGRLLIQSENSEPFNPLRLSSGEKAVHYAASRSLAGVYRGDVPGCYGAFALCFERDSHRVRPVAFLAVERRVSQSVRV